MIYCVRFLHLFQQKAGNAEKFDYVSTDRVTLKSGWGFVCLIWVYLIFIYLFFLIPCKGDELPEKDGGQRVCGFQQRHVSHTPTVHFNSLYTCTFMQLADQPITWQYSEILTPATSGTNNHVTVKVAPQRSDDFFILMIGANWSSWPVPVCSTTTRSLFVFSVPGSSLSVNQAIGISPSAITWRRRRLVWGMTTVLKFGNLLVYGLCSESETYVSVDMGKFDIFSRVTHPNMFLFFFFSTPSRFSF